MPRSKHRHKNERKAIRHPGKHKQPAKPPEIPGYREFASFMENYSDKFHEQFPDADADLLLDFIAESSFDTDTLSVRPVSKTAAFDDFLGPVPDETRTLESAEAALAFLVEHGYALVDGDQISVPEQFIPKFE